MQGFNMGRYYPPSADHPPQFNTSSSLRAATKRTPAGTQTVRFEMPFHVWCGHCPRETIIPQGVRFNAMKRKVGMYHSTPVWSFRIKHTICGGELEIRTEPKEGEYIVYEGGRRRDYGGDKEGEGAEAGFVSPEERARRREDAFAALEGKKEEAARGVENKERVEELLAARERDWSDPYAASRRVRKGFRRERKVRLRDESEKEAIKDKYGLSEDMVLEGETEADAMTAALIDFESGKAEYGATTKSFFRSEEGSTMKLDQNESLLKSSQSRSTSRSTKKSGTDALQQQLRDNTRAQLDPFHVDVSRPVSSKPLLGVRSKSAGSKTNHRIEAPSKTSPAHDHDGKGSSRSVIDSLDYESD